jgi:predicted house-cleaning NTP pyrophosphatase (Maf/HAM1 superfamily)
MYAPRTVWQGLKSTEVTVLPGLVCSVIHSLHDWLGYRRYVDSGEPMDKAGGYGIQAAGGQLISGIQGCFYNVMGFPMHRFSAHLAELLSDGRVVPPAPAPSPS